MYRRTVLERLGVVSAGLAGVSGVTSAGGIEDSPDPSGVFAEIDRTFDVSDRSGPVPLSDLLTRSELARASDDLTTTAVVVGDEQTTLDLSADGCGCFLGCCDSAGTCHSDCCACYCEACDSTSES